MTDAGRLRLAIDLDGVLTEHPRPLAQAASARFGVEMPESAFVDSAGLNVPDQVRDWVYSPDGPAAKLQPDPRAAEFLRRAIALVGAENIAIVTARPEPSAEMTRSWLRAHGFPECPIVFADLKAAVALRSGFSHAVEDSLRHARNYAAAGVRCFLVKAGEPGDKLDDPMIAAADDLDALFDIIADHIARGGQDAVNDPLTTSFGALESDGEETRPVIVISDAIHPAARDRLAAAARIVEVDGLNVPALLDAVRDADALVVRSETEVTEEVLAAGPNLRVVARAGVGVDNIDLNAATRAGVLVLNTPGANAVSAAEHTIALLLAVTRQIVPADVSTRAGNWPRKQMRPIDLAGRTVGIVGLGRVGSQVARRLRAFEMRVLAYDPYIAPQRFTELGAAPVDFETLLQSSDVVTFHVPENAETFHLLNREAIAKLKPGAIVINAARGGVVDEEALAEALADGRIRGVGVDVFPQEPAVNQPPLRHAGGRGHATYRRLQRGGAHSRRRGDQCHDARGSARRSRSQCGQLAGRIAACAGTAAPDDRVRRGGPPAGRARTGRSGRVRRHRPRRGSRGRGGARRCGGAERSAAALDQRASHAGQCPVARRRTRHPGAGCQRRRRSCAVA